MDDVTALSWIERALNISLFLVAIGVAGEFVGNWVASPIRRRLDTAKELEIARLNKEAGEARKAAGDAIERAASVEQNAEKESLARIKIEERLAWRVLSPDQQARMASKLSDFRGYRVDIGTSPDTVEGARLAGQIQAVLTSAGWLANKTAGMMDIIASGVVVRTTTDARGVKAGLALVEALRLSTLKQARQPTFRAQAYPQ